MVKGWLMLDRILGWLFAAVLAVVVVVGTGFTHPAWLPERLHAYLLAHKLAVPLSAADLAAVQPAPQGPAGGAPAQGQGKGQIAAGQPQQGQGQPQGQSRPAGAPPAGQGGGRPVAVEAAKVMVGTVRATLSAVGSLTADERVDITTEVEGRIAEIAFQEGADVAAGDVLFRLDDLAVRAAVAQTAADVSLAEANYSRAETLSAQKIATDKTRDEAKFALEKARANAQIAQINLDKTVIRAPFAGRTGLRKVSLGNYVTKGLSLVSLQSIDPIKVDFRLPETELANVALGNRIDIEVDALPGKKFVGEVFAIDPQVDVNGRAIQLRARVANKEKTLKPGLFARVDLVTAEHANALQVPESAIVTQGRDRMVYVVRDGKAQQVKVTTGIRLPGRVEVAEGLKPEDVVVVSGQQRLRNGVAVDVVGSGPAG
jgi:membrane fusion protein, multidrug efflux system